MIEQWFSSETATGLIQAFLAAVLALMVMLAARRRKIHLEKEISSSLARGILQVVLAGSVLALLFQTPTWTALIVLAGMILGAALISSKRSRGIPQSFRLSFLAIGAGSSVVIALMTWSGVMARELTVLIPIGSMIIANSMNTNSLALDRLRSEVESHVGFIEAGLCLGAGTETVVQPYVESAVYASLIPRIDSLRSLGIVWIPGVMAGMILQGADPVYAALYQFVVMAMIFSAGAITTLVGTGLIRHRIFSPAEQLDVAHR